MQNEKCARHTIALEYKQDVLQRVWDFFEF